jgi:hypothetical protein
MALDQNQFAQTVVQGMIALDKSVGTISVQIDASSGGGLVPGQAVKMVDSAGGIPKVVECAATTDDVFGFINYDMRRAMFGVGDKVEISSMHGNIMWMTASAAIARNAKVMLVIAGSKVVTAGTTGNVIIGRALDKAAANGDLIRVIIDLPGLLVP